MELGPVPKPFEVASALEWLGGHASAVALCDTLRARGFREREAQLGMQRAWDCSGAPIIVNNDWTLSLAHPHQENKG